MFKTRLLSGVVLLLALLGMLFAGGEVLLFSLTAIALIGLFEFYRIFQIEKSVIGLAGYLITLLYFLNMGWKVVEDQQLFLVGCLTLFLTLFVFTYPKYKANQIFAAMFGIIYVGVMISAVYHTRMLPFGIYLVWLIFVCSWGSDTCAYCVGVLFGKHKLAPVLSPKKSIEGAIGGIIGSSLIALIYGIVLWKLDLIHLSTIGIWVFIAAVGSVFSQIGDLAASGIKRNFEIKDYGNLIPGHGGIMDRFDSVFFTAPFVFYLCYYFLG